MMFVPPDLSTNKDQLERNGERAVACFVLWLRELSKPLARD